MGSLLGPMLADIFKVDLENRLGPTLTEYIKSWKRFVDDTICFVKMGSVKYIVSILNSFDMNVQFTHKMKKKCYLPACFMFYLPDMKFMSSVLFILKQQQMICI